MKVLTKESLLQAIKKVIGICKDRKFNTQYINANLYFKRAKNNIDRVEFDIVDTNEYTEVIEQVIRTTKENIRSLI